MGVPVSKLELAWKQEKSGDRHDFLDFVIDGRSLRDLIDGDFSSCLGWFTPYENEKAIKRLLLEEPADLPNNRRSIFVCPLCGDIGCGAITIMIEQNANSIIWRDFGYENDYEERVEKGPYKGIGPFVFDLDSYRVALRAARQMQRKSNKED